MTYKQFEVVRIPFPFTDRNAAKNRPALVLSESKSFNTPARHAVMAMITSAGNASWPLDYPITDLKSAGLPSASVVRCKLFTLDHRLIIDRLGTLSKKDQTAVRSVMTKLLGVNE